MNSLALRHKYYWKDEQFVRSFATSAVLLLASLVINYIAGWYATRQASSPVTDIVLSNIRTWDVDGFFVYGALVMWVYIVVLLIWQLERVPYAFKCIALFVLIRSVFISLTHLGIDPAVVPTNSRLLDTFSPGGDLFFSGHTGLPFLLALVFWDDRKLRIFFILSSLFFGAIALLGHLHYSIDVFAAFFITYAIYHLAEIFFKEDHARSREKRHMSAA